VNNNHDDFLEFMIALISELCGDPTIHVDSQFSCYDAAEHRMRAVVSTSDGQLFKVEFTPDCMPGLPGGGPALYDSLIKKHLAQQIDVATTLAQKFHAQARNEDEPIRPGGSRPTSSWTH
jgi:hypothetical protein